MHDKVDACHSLDVSRLHREGCLRDGWAGTWQWTHGDGTTASISLQAGPGVLHLAYRARIGGGKWERIAETVCVERVRCRFGGYRPYFVCPGVVSGVPCGRPVVKLYGPGRYFLCRHCYRLAYGSQSEGRGDRALRRDAKIRRRLGGEPGIVRPFPPRPKGMWRRTYERLQENAFAAERRANAAFIVEAGRLLARSDCQKRKGSFRA